MYNLLNGSFLGLTVSADPNNHDTLVSNGRCVCVCAYLNPRASASPYSIQHSLTNYLYNIHKDGYGIIDVWGCDRKFCSSFVKLRTNYTAKGSQQTFGQGTILAPFSSKIYRNSVIP